MRFLASAIFFSRRCRYAAGQPGAVIPTSAHGSGLGTACDAEIARQINRSQDAVRAWRNALGIPAWHVAYARSWTANEEALLGVAPDRLLAERLRQTTPWEGYIGLILSLLGLDARCIGYRCFR
jgi:hypothetical protein